MDEISDNSQCIQMISEMELKQKIQKLHNNMVDLMNKLNEEKEKLEEVLMNAESDSELYLPTEEADDSLDSIPILEQNSDLILRRNTKHHPNCKHSRVLLQIDPACKLHGNIHKKYGNRNSVQPKLSIFNIKEQRVCTEISSFAGGDLNKRNNEYSKIYITSSTSINQNVQPSSGDVPDELVCYEGYNLNQLTVENSCSSNDLNKNNNNLYSQNYITSSISSTTIDDYIQPPSVVKSNDELVCDENHGQKLPSLQMLNQFTEETYPLETINNVEPINENIKKPEREFSKIGINDEINLEMIEQVLHDYLLNGLNDDLNTNKMTMGNEKTVYNATYLQGEVDELNASVTNEGEIDQLITSLKLNYHNAFQDLTVDDLLEEIKQNLIL